MGRLFFAAFLLLVLRALAADQARRRRLPPDQSANLRRSFLRAGAGLQRFRLHGQKRLSGPETGAIRPRVPKASRSLFMIRTRLQATDGGTGSSSTSRPRHVPCRFRPQPQTGCPRAPWNHSPISARPATAGPARLPTTSPTAIFSHCVSAWTTRPCRPKWVLHFRPGELEDKVPGQGHSPLRQIIPTEKTMHALNFRTRGMIAFDEGNAVRIGALVKGRTSGKILLVTGPVLLRTGVADRCCNSCERRARPLRLRPEPAGNPPSGMWTKP